MGVSGLWKVLKNVGKPVKAKSLEGKILAIDISLWLNQSVKGVRDVNGNPVPHAHLLTLFNRICKLLHYKIKPVFVFDGGLPVLKKQTTQERANRRLKLNRGNEKGLKVLTKFVASQVKQSPEAVSEALLAQSLPSSRYLPAEDDIFAISSDEDEEENDDEDLLYSGEAVSLFAEDAKKLHDPQDIDKVDVDSSDFKALPLEIQHELLQQMREKRKGWAKMDEFPRQSDNFSDYQMQQLVKKRKLQQRIEDVQNEMNEATNIISVDEETFTSTKTRRVMSDESSRLVYAQKQSTKSCSSLPKPTSTPTFSITGKVSNDIFACSSEFDFGKSEAMTQDSSSRIKMFQRAEMSQVTNLMKRSLNNSSAVRYSKLGNVDSKPAVIAKPPTRKASNSSNSSRSVPNCRSRTSKSSDDILENLTKFETPTLEKTPCTVMLSEESDSDSTVTEEPHQEISDDDSTVEEFTSGHFAPQVEASNLPSEPAPVKAKETDIESQVKPQEEHSEPGPSSLSQNFTQVKQKKPETPPAILQEQLESLFTLPRELAKKERQSSTVSEAAVAECQELLRLFGMPYIVSPMEAEAQCAKLEQLNLVHGSITDDSDVWLFGAEVVFKNFFSPSKLLEMYTLSDIRKQTELDRETMICFALLVGSDYTEGVPMIGPATALEVIKKFRGAGISTLENYKRWWTQNQKNKEKKTGPKYKLLKYTLQASFPNPTIYNAYMEPTTDESAEKFTWGAPDFGALQQFAVLKLKWTRDKAESVLGPVMKRWSEKKIQPQIDEFLQIKK